MRLFRIALFISLSVAVADEPGRSLRPDEMKALQQPISVGRLIRSEFIDHFWLKRKISEGDFCWLEPLRPRDPNLLDIDSKT